MEKIKLEKDYGFEQTNKKYNGKFPTEDSWETVYKVTEDVAVYKPGGTLSGDGEPLAYVVCDAYPDNQVRECLMSIEDTTKMRANAAGPILPEEMKEKGITEYRLRTPNSYQVKTKSGKWGMIAYANEIYSVMAGWKRGRFTGDIDLSGWAKDNPEKFEILRTICKVNEKAFMKADPKRCIAQKTFCETYIKDEHRMGMCTTLSPNRYSEKGVGSGQGMSFHIDAGDNDQGMTTMAHFRDGDYTGGYLVFPRYKLAIEFPDNCVIIGDSLELHGVSPVYGEGTRFSCIAYCDRRLATEGQMGKSIKKIGKNANIATLENFL
jgi:hypothetical protein